jgi:phosphate transport system permease protein
MAAQAVVGIRERVLAAGVRIRRVKRIDRFATVFITLGGIFIIVCVSFIFLFIFGQALPLFRPAQGRSLGVVTLRGAEVNSAPLFKAGGRSGPPPPPIALPAGGRAGATPGPPLVLGIDEYQKYLYQLVPDGRFLFYRLSDGALTKEVPIGGGGLSLTSAARSVLYDSVAAGTSDGRVALHEVRYLPRYENQQLVDLEIEIRDHGVVKMDPAGRPVRDVSYNEREGWTAAAALVGDNEILLYRRNPDEGFEKHEALRTQDGERVTKVRLGRTDSLVAGTESGRLYYWEISPEVRLTNVVSVSDAPITALEYSLGSVSVLVGDAAGQVSAWFRVRVKDDDVDLALVRAHQFPGQGAAITAIGPSPRDKSFVTAAADGSLVLRHLTSERTVLSFPATGAGAEGVLMAPKSDALLVRRADGQLARYQISSPHPEVSWRALFGKVWYEGYSQPQYVWQSTGATDDFESKFSLVPLIFGTIKGTAYALLFAVPIAIMAALYTSQFAHPTIRQRVKPVVETMAALPSVVVGFIAGLWLASRVEREVVPVLLMLALLPAFGTAGILFWDRLPSGLRRRLRPGMELAVIVPLAFLGCWVAILLGGPVEAALFGGDFKSWLNSALGLVYDQRNSLVVGLAMGFAVIPIIFTISEDSFSSVPSHLTAASLALGASRWQTALRVVLPTASPGIFSAVMVGFGRAVGETMIVLMATGNTPVLDWSIFNGMRTLSANIAVEIPEAPYGGTLYRVLFLAGGVLFLMTFMVNTLAEVVRQRLRERYRAL